MQNQYRSMLLEAVYLDNMLEKFPHLGEGMVELCVNFFDKFDSDRDGRLDEDDFVRGMKVYGKLAKDPNLSRRVALEHAFTQADASGDRAVTISEFIGHLGREGRLHVKPELLAEACGFVKPDELEYAVDVSKRQPRAAGEHPDAAEQRPGPSPDGSRIVNFMSTDEGRGMLLPDSAGPESKRGDTTRGKKASRIQKGGLLDRMGEKAFQGIDKMANLMESGEDAVEVARRLQQQKAAQMQGMARQASMSKFAGAGGGRHVVNGKVQEDALLDQRNLDAAERLALRRQNQQSRRGNDGNFIKKKQIDTDEMQANNKGTKVAEGLSNMGGDRFNRFLSNLAT